MNNPRCANSSIPGDLTGGTVALRSSQGSPSQGFPCCRIWQGCHNPLMWAASALGAAWGCSSHSGQVSGQKPDQKSGQSRETTPTQPCLTEGRCIQLLTTCITYALPGHCSASKYPKPCWCRDTGCPRVTCSPVKGSDCCTGSCISGTADLGSGKGRVREGLSMVLVQPLYISKGRKKADAGEWS